MKKIILCIAVVTVFSTAFVSCKKESIPTKTPPTPIIFPEESGSLAQLLSGKDVTFSKGNGDIYEIDLTFKSSFKGNIKSIKVNLPVKGKNEIMLSKKSDHTVIATQKIVCDKIGKWDNSVAVYVPIEANQEYILSIKSANFYTADVAAQTFPFNHGSITLLDCQKTNISLTENTKADQVNIIKPKDIPVFGFVDFTFERSEKK